MTWHNFSFFFFSEETGDDGALKKAGNKRNAAGKSEAKKIHFSFFYIFLFAFRKVSEKYLRIFNDKEKLK
jgi:hypothetical protein